MYAVLNRDVEIATLLLYYGADIVSTDNVRISYNHTLLLFLYIMFLSLMIYRKDLMLLCMRTM
jgi:hypothetical protein